MIDDEQDMVGFDPLAWLKEDDEEIIEVDVSGEPATDEQAVVANDSSSDEILEEAPQPEKDAATSAEEVPAATEERDDMIDLGDNLHISGVAELHERLKKAIAEGDVILDASRVEAADGAALQLLCGLMQEAAKRELKVEWRGVPDTLRESAQLLGIDQEIWPS